MRSVIGAKMSVVVASVLSACVAASLWASGHAAPVVGTGLSSIMIESLKNKTTCPFSVELDEAEDRIPRSIRRIKCLGHCEGCKRAGYECVQAFDSVEFVFVEWDDDRSETITKVKFVGRLQVEVGCYCAHASLGNVQEATRLQRRHRIT